MNFELENLCWKNLHQFFTLQEQTNFVLHLYRRATGRRGPNRIVNIWQSKVRMYLPFLSYPILSFPFHSCRYWYKEIENRESQNKQFVIGSKTKGRKLKRKYFFGPLRYLGLIRSGSDKSVWSRSWSHHWILCVKISLLGFEFETSFKKKCAKCITY